MPSNCKSCDVLTSVKIIEYSLLRCDTVSFEREVRMLWKILQPPVCRYKSEAAPTSNTLVPICLMTGCHNPEDPILYGHHCKKPQISKSTYSIYSIDGNHPQYSEMKHSINFTKSAICIVHATSHVNLCCDLRLCFLQILRICVKPITGRKPLVGKHYEQVYFLLQPWCISQSQNSNKVIP